MNVMNEQDLELLSQFIDGELVESDANALRQRLLAEPSLRAQYERLKAANTRVSEAFSGAEFETVPEHITAALAGANTASTARGNVLGWHHGAVAASVLAAAVLLVSPQWGGKPVHESTLASVLESAPSRAQGWEVLSDGSEVRPLLSFRSIDGAYCREYLLQTSDSAQRGVACRGEGEWSVQVSVAQLAPGATTDYRPASSQDVDVIATFVTTHADGDVLSLADEAAVMERNWQ